MNKKIKTLRCDSNFWESVENDFIQYSHYPESNVYKDQIRKTNSRSKDLEKFCTGEFDVEVEEILNSRDK